MPHNRGLNEPVVIDGARGEGGGQILRTSLALSMITGRPLHMERIRAGRAKPGLRRQHLACIEAAARLCHAAVRGDRVGSQELVFTPGAITGGEMEIDIGTAGSTTLVVQTIAVPAIAAGVALRAVIRGGTHNPLAPPFEFLERVWLPHLHAMGAKVSLTLDRHGFASGGHGGSPRRDDRDDYGGPPRRGDRDDQGGPPRRDDRGDHGGSAGRGRGEHESRGAAERANGQITLEIGAGGALGPIELARAGPVTSRRATAILSRLPSHVAEREHAIVRERLGFTAAECEVREVRGAGPANVLLIEIERAGGRELVSAFGEKGLRAERVAQQACDDAAAFLAADVPVGEHLADQLLLPLAVAGGGRFRSMPLSLHATTNIATIRAFLDVAIEAAPDPAGPTAAGAVTVTIGAPRRAADHL